MGKKKRTAPASLLVTASIANQAFQKVEVCGYKCTDCNTSFSANRGLRPLCVQCGSEGVEELDDGELEIPMEEDVRALDDEEMAYATCSNPDCSMHTVMSSASAAAFGGHMHCLVCGSEINYEADEEEGDEVESEDIEDEMKNATIDDIDGTPVTESGKKCSTSMLELASATKDITTAKFVRSGSVVLCFVDDLCVAKLHLQEKASNSYMDQVRAAFSTNGLEQTLKDFKFTVPLIAFDMSKIRTKEVEAAAAAERARIQQEMASTREELTQCLGIAASGLNRGFFREHANTLRSELIAQFKAIGVRNPVKVIDSVFASTFDDYNRSLLEIAMGLMEKPVDVRQHLAQAVGAASPVTTSDDEDEDDQDDLTPEGDMDDMDDEDSDELSSRLSAPVTASVESHRSTPRSLQQARNQFRGRMFGSRS